MSIIPAGLCHCGCGEPTNPAPYTWKARGWIKGQPMKYVNGHSARVQVRKRKHADKRAKDRAYSERNREALRARGRAYYRANKEAFKRRAKEWADANREKVRAINRACYHSRRDAPGKHTASEIARMIEDQDGLCAYCETPLGGDYHVDHMIPLSRGGHNGWENLAAVCAGCNLSKHTKTAEEFFTALPSTP